MLIDALHECRFQTLPQHSITRLILITLLCGIICGCGDRSQSETPAQHQHSDAAVGHDPANGFIGLTFESIDQSPLVIRGTVPGSDAEQFDIRPNDILTGVADVQNPTFEDVHRILQQALPGDTVTVVIKRGDEQWPLQLRLLSFDDVQSAMEAKPD